MKALITGTSSGIGKEFAILLDRMGYDIIAVARREDKLNELKSILKNNTQIHIAVLGKREECFNLFYAYPDIDILINNAGSGVFGEFSAADIKKELDMIDVNLSAVHILTKLYLNEFKKKNKGYILNIASTASFFPGPLFSSYYASKAYVYRLTRAISYELKKEHSNVSLSIACPGPVDTEFNSNMGIHSGVGAISAKNAAKYCLKMMFRKKLIIIPGFSNKFTRLISKLLPDCLTERLVYIMQKKKQKA